MANATATLMAHSGAVKVQRGDLIHIPTPPRTMTFMPVPHFNLVDLIENNLTSSGYGIEKSEYAVQDGKLDGKVLCGAKLFATFVLKHSRTDFAFALGLRASNDKSMAIEMVAGCRVFVCDNMSLCGEADLMWRKHTNGLDRQTLRMAVGNGVSKAIARFGGFETGINRLKETNISDTEAKANIFDAVVKGVIPQAFLPKVGAAYFEPPHKEFEPRTLWSLHNAYTEVIKNEYATKPHLVIDTAQSVGAMFAL
jgi:Domain of unknown function (DUF932)